MTPPPMRPGGRLPLNGATSGPAKPDPWRSLSSNMSVAPDGSRLEQLLEEANALKRDALAAQQESLALQKQALAEQRKLIDDTRANLEIARGVNERAAELQTKARRALALLVPLIVVLVLYVSWLLFFRIRT